MTDRAVTAPDTTLCRPATDQSQEPGRTLGEAIDLYLDLERRRTKSTDRGITQKQSELRVLINAFGADTRVSAVTAQMAG